MTSLFVQVVSYSGPIDICPLKSTIEKQKTFKLLYHRYSMDAVGVAPLKEMVDVVEGIKSLDDMTEYLVNTPGEDRLFCLWTPEAMQDPEEPGNNMLSLRHGSCFLEDPAEYRNMTAEGEYRKEVFTVFSRKMLVKLGYSEEEDRAAHR